MKTPSSMYRITQIATEELLFTLIAFKKEARLYVTSFFRYEFSQKGVG